MISLWPVRTGVLVDGDVAYFAAGVFPAEGVFFSAVDARTGLRFGVTTRAASAQSPHLAARQVLVGFELHAYVPMGRVSPAAFDRKTGELTDLADFGKNIGGTYALLGRPADLHRHGRHGELPGAARSRSKIAS